jgi:hypothetical protein
MHPLLTMLVLALTFAASSYQFHARPLLITLALLGWSFARLGEFEAGRIPLRSLFWLVPIGVLWANCHAGMLAGLGTLGLAVAGWIAAKLLRQPSPILHWRQAIALAALVLLCALTALVNPYGTQLPRLWLSLIGSPVLPRLIQEHAPLLVSWPEAAPVLLLGLVYLAALAGALPARRRVTWLIPLAWFVLALTSIRHGPLFAITAALALADMFPHVRWAAWLARRGSVAFRIQPAPRPAPGAAWDVRPALIPLVLVSTAALLQLAAVPFPLLGRGWAQPGPTCCPLALLPALRAGARERSGGTPVFNEMLFGGFLIYYTPEMRVFLDDRCELYGDHWLEEFADARDHHPERIEQWAEDYGFDQALVEAGSGFDQYLGNAKGGWVLVGRTQSAALYRRAPNPKEGA